jgi:hypothetical protein
MTDPAMQTLREFRADVPGPDSETTLHIYRRTVARQPSRSGRWGQARTSLKRRPALVAVLLAMILGIAGGASALAIHYLGPSPGFSAGFSSFDRLPPAELPTFLSRQDLERDAAYIGIPKAEVTQRLRLLQSGLTLGRGRTQGAGRLYALIGPRGTACLYLAGQFGTCVDEANAPHAPGVLMGTAGGYPGQTPAVVAIVADNVTDVWLDHNNERRAVSIVNNSIYVDQVGVHTGDRVALVFEYADGTTREIVVPNSGGS